MKIHIALLGMLMLLSTTAFGADVTGIWQVTISGTGQDGTEQKDTGQASLKQSGDKVTGWVGPNESRQMPIVEGTIKDNKVILKVAPGPDRVMTFELTLNGEKLVGTVGRTGDTRTGTVEFVKSTQK
jgi:hypothetical protein